MNPNEILDKGRLGEEAGGCGDAARVGTPAIISPLVTSSRSPRP